MAQAKHGDTVNVHYTGRLSDGTVFETSQGLEPLRFTIGDNKIIPAIEQMVVGMNPGESKTIRVPADEAYGPRHDEMIIVVDRNEFPEDIEPHVGMELEVHQEDSMIFPVRVTDVSEGSITLDANHPLAGEDLSFDIVLTEIV